MYVEYFVIDRVPKGIETILDDNPVVDPVTVFEGTIYRDACEKMRAIMYQRDRLGLNICFPAWYWGFR